MRRTFRGTHVSSAHIEICICSDVLCCAAWTTSCRGDEFRCSVSNFCLAPSWRCDGEPDCGAHDASDEDPYMCTYNFQALNKCGTESILNIFTYLVGQKDFKCPGNSARCETPVEGQFTCVAIEQFCDGARQCPDASDEWDICDNCAYRTVLSHFCTLSRGSYSNNVRVCCSHGEPVRGATLRGRLPAHARRPRLLLPPGLRSRRRRPLHRSVLYVIL